MSSHSPFLAITCKSNLQYYDCGSACPKTCDNMMSMTKCPSDCVDGCHCPPDMYYDKEYERCVKREQCSCYWDGVHYAHLSLRRGDVEDW